MATVKHQILFSRGNNEQYYTSLDPICDASEIEARGINLDAMWHGILYHDDWRPMSAKKYEIREVELPDWLSVSEYCSRVKSDREALVTQLSGLTGKQALALIDLDIEKRAVCVKLLETKKFRSSFRQSLRDQLDRWIDDAEKKYDSPFSWKQWSCLLRYR